MRAYQKLCTEFYEIDKPEAPAEAYAFYRQFVSQAKGPVLEPMCGSGRFLLPLLAEGFDVEGSDSSPQMLEACRQKAAKRGLKPRLREETLEALAPDERYQLAFICSGSFSIFIDMKTVRENLKRLHGSLAKGGKLVIEAERYGGVPSGPGNWGGRWVKRPDGAKIVVNWLNQAGPEPKVNDCLLRYDLIKDGKIIETEVEDFPLRSYDEAEFEGLLKEAGFSGIKRWRTFAFEAPGPKDESLLFEAVKV